MKFIILFCILLPLIHGQKPNGLESLKGFQEDPPEEFESLRGKRSPQELDNTEIRFEFESRLQEDPPEELESLRGKRSPHEPLDNTEIRVNRLQEDPPEEFESRGKRSPQRLQEDPPEEFESRGKRSPQSFQEDPPEELESSRGKRSVQIPAGAGLIRMARRSNGGGRRRNGVGLLDNTGLRSNGLQEDPPEELGSRRGRRSPQAPGVAGLTRGKREHDPAGLLAVTLIPPPHPLF
ncbi:uncharacterized protein LOC106708093 isoform X2 [Papilio machaon]|uniref:uncharacterized protein LOC106708093 isoform X2 n=1 Tax=Papilio machaon TaxID=76193 RepID=UPI001E66379A|nr:uncharacterized protein LOC106708093 isoform X2 [Papilio machaon]